MVPESPTVTNNPVVVELSVLVVLEELLEEVQDMEMKLKRNRERRMSRFFTWFPISGLGEPNI
jgi:7,8-dihydro-6-hydroxymethylpterin-pyrophosphokinase